MAWIPAPLWGSCRAFVFLYTRQGNTLNWERSELRAGHYPPSTLPSGMNQQVSMAGYHLAYSSFCTSDYSTGRIRILSSEWTFRRWQGYLPPFLPPITLLGWTIRLLWISLVDINERWLMLDRAEEAPWLHTEHPGDTPDPESALSCTAPQW